MENYNEIKGVIDYKQFIIRDDQIIVNDIDISDKEILEMIKEADENAEEIESSAEEQFLLEIETDVNILRISHNKRKKMGF